MRKNPVRCGCVNWHLPGICFSCDSQFSQYHCWCWLWLYWSNLWHIAQTRLRRPTQRYILSNSCPVKNAQTRLRNREKDKTKMRFVRFLSGVHILLHYTLWVSICKFLTPPPSCQQFFRTIRWQFDQFLTPPPFQLPISFMDSPKG